MGTSIEHYVIYVDDLSRAVTQVSLRISRMLRLEQIRAEGVNNYGCESLGVGYDTSLASIGF